MANRRVPRVFISYSHDSARHQERVLDLADRLRADGIDAEIDQYNQAPPEGWALWCERQIEAADVVLMVCTETYRRRVMGEEKPGQGLGAVWEVRIIRQLLYDAGAVSDKVVPVLFSDGSPEHIPTPIKAWSRYVGDTEEGYESLYRRLTGQPLTPRPELGEIRALPPRTRQWSGRRTAAIDPVTLSDPVPDTSENRADRMRPGTRLATDRNHQRDAESLQPRGDAADAQREGEVRANSGLRDIPRLFDISISSSRLPLNVIVADLLFILLCVSLALVVPFLDKFLPYYMAAAATSLSVTLIFAALEVKHALRAKMITDFLKFMAFLTFLIVFYRYLDMRSYCRGYGAEPFGLRQSRQFPALRAFDSAMVFTHVIDFVTVAPGR